MTLQCQPSQEYPNTKLTSHAASSNLLSLFAGGGNHRSILCAGVRTGVFLLRVSIQTTIHSAAMHFALGIISARGCAPASRSARGRAACRSSARFKSRLYSLDTPCCPWPLSSRAFGLSWATLRFGALFDVDGSGVFGVRGPTQAHAGTGRFRLCVLLTCAAVSFKHVTCTTACWLRIFQRLGLPAGSSAWRGKVRPVPPYY